MNEPNKPSTIYGNAIFVRARKDVPQQDHWAILKFIRITTPGYDKGDPPDEVTAVEWVMAVEREIGHERARGWRAEVERRPAFGND